MCTLLNGGYCSLLNDLGSCKAKRIVQSWFVDLWLLAALCSFSSCAESGRRVTQQELGVRWPWTVESGHVDCDHGALIFRYDGTTYALNVTALSKGSPGIDSIWKTEAVSLVCLNSPNRICLSVWLAVPAQTLGRQPLIPRLAAKVGTELRLGAQHRRSEKHVY